MPDLLLKMDSPPSDPYFNTHYHADFIELNALINNDLGVDLNDFASIYESEPTDKIQANLKSLSEDCAGVIMYRLSAYGTDSYPFIIENGSKLKLKDLLSDLHKAYIFLLLCSCSKYLSTENASIVRRDFERFSNSMLKRYLRESDTCHIMGKAGIQEQRYKGHITDKLDLLAKDTKTKTLYEEHYFSEKNSGDGGLDLIAWSPFLGDDNFKFTPLYIGQCATGRDWIKKQDEPAKLARYIDKAGPMTVCLFIPYDGRNSTGTFNHDADIRHPTNIIFDRLRLLLISKDMNFINEIPAFKLVDDIICFEEDLI
ncbi:hypothetical protein [Pseudoalteromonas sp. Angola-4]|uniref:hypothetical protein n=1 Tax=Pseudoalteromonas sp. Angola-4 TaxID=3025335 RepID=UPI0023598EFB|nr:hypothetical protein [Pseudoalteromonas sp. Angola-4]MDC9511306.1 hypothetical protein [Pseudoalteromonas sp. Angola-4]